MSDSCSSKNTDVVVMEVVEPVYASQTLQPLESPLTVWLLSLPRIACSVSYLTNKLQHWLRVHALAGKSAPL